MENQDDSTSFIAFFRNEIAKSSLKESTKRNHLSTLELLRSYKKDVSFSESTLNLYPKLITIFSKKDIILIQLRNT